MQTSASEQRMATPETDVMVEATGLSKYFRIKSTSLFGGSQTLEAVHQVSFSIAKGEVFGLVGESGCGKSTLGRLILRLLKPTTGQIVVRGQEITKLSERELRPMRKQMQVIFQDPYASLNPRMTVGSIIGEALKIHRICTRKERVEHIANLLETVGLHPGAMNKYPHEFSGGQRQRVGIARALAVRPKFIVADEPVSALDVSIQAQIINLLGELRDRFQLTYLFISHDLDLVEFICDRVAIMYLGRLMEILPARGLHSRAQHPYAKALIAAIPNADPKDRAKGTLLKSDVASAVNPPKGCVFHTRCSLAVDQCRKKVPELRKVGEGHYLACDQV